MRVRCIRIINPVTRKVEQGSTWIRVGHEYTVLSLGVSPGRRVELQLIDDDGGPSLWDASMFVTVDPRLPSIWTAAISEVGRLDLAPDRWHRNGFWDDFFDRDPNATVVFHEDVALILGEDDRDPGG